MNPSTDERACDCGGVCGTCRGVGLAVVENGNGRMAKDLLCVPGNAYLVDKISIDCLQTLVVAVPNSNCHALFFWDPSEITVSAPRGLMKQPAVLASTLCVVLMNDMLRSSQGAQSFTMNSTTPTESYAPPNYGQGGKREIGFVNYEFVAKKDGLNQELTVALGPAIDCSMAPFSMFSLSVKFLKNSTTSQVYCFFASGVTAPGSTAGELSLPRVIETYTAYAGINSAYVTTCTFPAGASPDDFTVTRRFFDPSTRPEHMAFMNALMAKANWR